MANKTSTAQKGIGYKIKNMTDTNMLLTITIVIFFLMYIGAIVFQGEGFLRPQTFLSMLNANGALIITSCGMSLVMITGGIDISVGGVVALVSMCSAVYLDYHNGSILGAVLISLGIGLAFGIVQGYLVAYLDIQPFIVSLAGMFFARGMTAIISKDMISITNETFMAWAKMKLYLPFGGYLNKKGVMVYPYMYPTVVIALVFLVLAFIMLKYTKFGRSIYAVGGNEQSALMMGLNVRRVKLKAYVLDGFLCGVGSILFCLNTLGGFGHPPQSQVRFPKSWQSRKPRGNVKSRSTKSSQRQYRSQRERLD